MLQEGMGEWRILILGGTGETGSWFARYFKEKGFDVAVWGPSGKVEVAERLGVRYAHDMMLEVEESDIVLVSVLIEKTVEVIRMVAPRMHPGSLIMDVTSIKSGPVKAMKTYAPKGVEVLGTHPMFGPTMSYPFRPDHHLHARGREDWKVASHHSISLRVRWSAYRDPGGGRAR